MNTTSKILTYNELDAFRIASKDKTIVFTNGCFDILHAGHVDILEKAKSFGDILVVGLNDDASVSRLKGASRPINGLDARMRVLSGLLSVDFIIPFEADTPVELIKLITPNVLVKGGDYTLETIIGADFVIELGGKVEIVPITKGYSTTNIIKQMNKET